MKRTINDFWGKSSSKAPRMTNYETTLTTVNNSQNTSQNTITSTITNTNVSTITCHVSISTTTSLETSTIDTASTNSRPTLLTTQSTTSTGPLDIALNKTEKPRQPVGISFPFTKFGKTNRSFKPNWYSQFCWLEYSVSANAVFCFACRFFLVSTNSVFTTTGYQDWKHAIEIMKTHSKSEDHIVAMTAWNEYKQRAHLDQSVGVQLDRIGKKVIDDNRKYVCAIMEAVLFCAQQGIAFRGHDESHTSHNPGNLRATINLLSRHSPIVAQRLTEHKNSATWLAPAFQNEIIRFLADEVRDMIKKEVQEAKYFTLLVDETKDISKREQLSIAFRYVYNNKTVERFSGFSLASSLTAVSLTEYIEAKMSQLELNPSYLVSQCYDGASVMSGCNSGVQTLIREKYPQAVYVHCYAHQLNLVLVDVVKKVRSAYDFFSLLQSVYVFLSSSKAHEIFLATQKARGGREIRLKKLCETRWACRYESISSIMCTFSAVLDTLQQIINGNDRERAVEATGILSGLNSFSFIVNLIVYKNIFGITAQLSDALQSESLDIGNAANLVVAAIDTFEEMRSDAKWDLLWEEALLFSEHNLSESLLVHRRIPRQSRLPARVSDSIVTETVGYAGNTDSSNSYKVDVYFTSLDVVLSELKDRFSTVSITLMKSIDCLHPKSGNFLSQSLLSPLLSHYENIMPDGNITAEIEIFKNYLHRNPFQPNENKIHDVLQRITPLKEALPILTNCFMIGMTFGTSTATVERSFSSLKRLKSYLRSTMTQERLDDLGILNIESHLSSDLWRRLDTFDDLVVKFAQKHKNSRIRLF